MTMFDVSTTYSGKFKIKMTANLLTPRNLPSSDIFHKEYDTFEEAKTALDDYVAMITFEPEILYKVEI